MPSLSFDQEFPCAAGSKECASGVVIEPWEMLELEVPGETDLPTRETLFSVGNGFVGMRGYHESVVDSNSVSTPSTSAIDCRHALQAAAASATVHRNPNMMNNNALESTLSHNPVVGPVTSHRGTYINGVYDEHMVNNMSTSFPTGGCKRECFLVAVPDAAAIECFVNDERISPFMNPGKLTSYRRVLDLKTGELRRKFSYITGSGAEVQVTETRFACAARKNIIAIKHHLQFVPSTSAQCTCQPTMIDAKISSRTVLPEIEAAINCWEVEERRSQTRHEDVSSMLRVRTKRSRKHVTVATTDRCFVANSSHLSNFVSLEQTDSDMGLPPIQSPCGVLIGQSPPMAAQPSILVGGGGSFALAGAAAAAAALSNANESRMFGAPVTYLTPCATTTRLQEEQSPAEGGGTAGGGLGDDGNTPPLSMTSMMQHNVGISSASEAAAAGHYHSHPHRSGSHNAAGLETVFRASLPCGDPQVSLVLIKFVAYVTEADCEIEDLEQYATELVENALDAGYDGLLAEQREYMDKFWQASDVSISCNHPRAQGTLRYNLLQLSFSTGRWKHTGVGPRGLTGEVFNGLQSWDAEIFVLPFFLHSNPQVARSLLQFRVDTLPDACRRASEFELRRGAIFPSRTINGGENAPSLQCVLHLHVNADIAYAIKQYFEATNDLDFMIHGGIEVVWTTALVWIDWGAWEKGEFHLRNVTGPDEYNVLVDDNYYTNLMAQHHMKFAVALRDRLYSTHAVDLERLLTVTQLTDEDFRYMQRAAEKMALPYDPHNRIHLQDANFLRKRSWDKVPPKDFTGGATSSFGTSSSAGGVRSVALSPASSDAQLDASNHNHVATMTSGMTAAAAKRTPRRQASTLAFRHSVNNTPIASASSAQHYMPGEASPLVMIQEYHPIVVFRHRICKNADVVLAAVLLRNRFTRDEKEANLTFYETLTAHDSSLTPPMFSIASSDLQLRDKAIDYFKYSLFIDMFNVLKNTSGGLHMSCLAGSWLCIVAGFAGFHVVDGIAHFNPWMPDGWEEYRFQIRHHGSLIQVTVSRRAVTYTLTEGTKIVIVHAQSARVHLANHRPVTIRLVRDVRSFDFDAVVFDVDSIIDNVEEDHFEAWRRTLDPIFQANAGSSGGEPFKFNNEMYLAYLKHHPISQTKRHQGLQRLLLKRGIEMPIGEYSDSPSDATMYGLIATKLLHFRSIVKERGVHVRAGTLQLLADLRENGVVIGVVSASKNGLWMMQQAPAVLNLVDCFVDANQGEEHHLRWRPELDYFDHCTRKMETTTSRTIIFVDGIDGFSKKSLQNYWLIVNSSVEDDTDLGIGPGSLNTGDGGEMGEEVQLLHVSNFELLSTDTLHERGAFMPPQRNNAVLQQQQRSPKAPLNNSFFVGTSLGNALSS